MTTQDAQEYSTGMRHNSQDAQEYPTGLQSCEFGGVLCSFAHGWNGWRACATMGCRDTRLSAAR